ncbi:SRPBCC family protein [Pukyongiella litopenaei]|uniref:SRPBCC family protein n=1 Tax=Pukyongiella litopenaei TaxID=2605946 RepID=A0A2S0MLK7_9RHOB|nr:SRPBCC family protein [Pukyongiella litopenaei]AVO36641.1 SRPBCC family protein [Pukyongiella litopenaei]
MHKQDDTNPTEPGHVLTLERVLDAPVDKVWRCWTEPELVQRWFCPRPWQASNVRIDLRPGGEFSSTMTGPNGESFDTMGVFLEIEPRSRLVTTDAFRPGWRPGDRAFMVAEMTLDATNDGRTRYVARAMHWTADAREEHEKMGFHDGWGRAAEQLEDLAKSL